VSRYRAEGFTLAELAVALVILALLLAGAMIPISTQTELRHIAETQRIQDQVREALIGFALVNGRLPCPASGTVTSSSSSAGIEQWDGTNNRCTATLGVVPWSTLAVPETDAWGRRLTYRVSPVFADAASASTWQTDTTTTPASPAQQSPSCAPSPTPANATFGMCSLGDMAVLTRNESTHATSALGAGLPAVVISHGKNGYGAYTPTGQRNGVGVTGDSNSDGVPDQNVDETANLAGTPSGTPPSGAYSQYLFYSRNPTTGTSGCSDTVSGSVFCEFDDIVSWVPTSALISRMLSSGRLP
jgi:prepilin-type N-terminal cleavage/methylation domain-containing protein